MEINGITVTDHALQGRGCGERDEGMPYLACGLGGTEPFDHFIVDPCRYWPGKWQRGVRVLRRNPKDESPNAVHDVVVFVGKEFYLACWDYVEETRRFGASRKVSPTLEFEKLTPFESRLVFVHAHAIPRFIYEVDRHKPLDGCRFFRDDLDLWDTNNPPAGWHPRVETESPCAFALRDLAWLHHQGGKDMDVNDNTFTIHMPSFDYSGRLFAALEPKIKDITPDELKWSIGIFLVLPLTHIEFCRKPHQGVKERLDQINFPNVTLEW